MAREGWQMFDCIRKPILFVILTSCGLLVSGCVVLEEKYNAEKARSLNFQRLLVQEEKRTAELDSEVRRTKAELAELEMRNRELAGQVQAVREHMARLQEEAETIKEATVLERKALEDMRAKNVAPPAKSHKSGPKIHVVKPGDTLFSIAKRYGIDVEQLKNMNMLESGNVEAGQKLVVGK